MGKLFLQTGYAQFGCGIPIASPKTDDKYHIPKTEYELIIHSEP
jgi:hypothetical protein